MATVLAATSASADWFTEARSRMSEQWGLGGLFGAPSEQSEIEQTMQAVKAQPRTALATLLTAVPSNAGHWTFVTREGETFTAANPKEMARAFKVLLPDTILQRIAVVMPVDALFTRRRALEALPPELKLRVATPRGVFPLQALDRDAAGSTQYAIALKPRLQLRAVDPVRFADALSVLHQPLRPDDVSIVSLTVARPDPPDLRPTTNRDAVRGEQIQADQLVAAMPSLQRRTAILTGRLIGAADGSNASELDAGSLQFRTAVGGSMTLALAPVLKAAAASDVNLVIVQSQAARQPGVRNWLWQRANVDGLDQALQRATLGDFLASVASGGQPLLVDVTRTDALRTSLRAVPATGSSALLDGRLFRDLLAEVMTETLGTVAATGVTLDVASPERRRELNRRLVPGVASWLQWGYGVMLVLGLIGFGVARRWWARVWPHEARAEYGSVAGYVAALIIRFLAFVALFLPAVGVPAAVMTLGRWLWAGALMSYRYLTGAKPRDGDQPA